MKKWTESLCFYNASQIWDYEATYSCAQPKIFRNMFFYISPIKYASHLDKYEPNIYY